MSTHIRIVTVLILVLAATATATFAQQGTSSSEAEALANKAIAQLAAWQNNGARKTLQAKKDSLGTSREFKTAWALLEIQEAADKAKAFPTTPPSNLSKAAKNGADPVAKFWEGEILYHQSKKNEANSAWQAAASRANNRVKADFTDATAQFYLGAAQVRQKKFEPARKALLLAARGGFDPAMVNHQYGLSYLFAENWQEARKAFDMGLGVNPRYAPMYYWRAMAWEKLGKKDKMLLDLDQFVKLAPNAPEAGRARAVLNSGG